MLMLWGAQRRTKWRRSRQHEDEEEDSAGKQSTSGSSTFILNYLKKWLVQACKLSRNISEWIFSLLKLRLCLTKADLLQQQNSCRKTAPSPKVTDNNIKYFKAFSVFAFVHLLFYFKSLRLHLLPSLLLCRRDSTAKIRDWTDVEEPASVERTPTSRDWTISVRYSS